jgi:hypothetical protein
MAAHHNLSAGQFFHGTPSGDLRGGHYGLHVGTRQAAADALNARIGEPAEGEWDGTRIYGQTKLRGSHGVSMDTGLRDTSADYYPDPEKLPTYSDGTKVAHDAIPEIMPVRITGPMTNTPSTPHEDFKANGMMAGQVKRGRAKRGYYYENVAEDEGSISAVVPPGGAHLERLDTKPKQMRFF